MCAYLLHFSPTGGTKKVLKLLGENFGDIREIDFSDFQKEYEKMEFSPNDLCIVAVPSFGGRVPKTAAERLSKMKGNNTPAVLVCVYGNRAYEDTLLELSDTLKEAGFDPRAAVAAVAEHSIMHQFAKGRPDKEDEAELKEFAEKIKKSLAEDSGKELSLPGNRPYKPLGGAMKPQVTEACTQCGICAKVCPVLAISVDNPRETDENTCISCMRCVSVCPNEGRVIEEKLLEALIGRIGKALEGRKPNELILPQ